MNQTNRKVTRKNQGNHLLRMVFYEQRKVKYRERVDENYRRRRKMIVRNNSIEKREKTHSNNPEKHRIKLHEKN